MPPGVIQPEFERCQVRPPTVRWQRQRRFAKWLERQDSCGIACARRWRVKATRADVRFR